MISEVPGKGLVVVVVVVVVVEAVVVSPEMIDHN